MGDFFQWLLKGNGISRCFATLILSGFTFLSIFKSNISKPVIQKLFSVSDNTFPIIPFCFWTGFFALLAGTFFIVILFIRKKIFEIQDDVGQKEIAKLDIQILIDCMIKVLLFGWFFGIILYNLH